MGFYTNSTINENFIEDIYVEESQHDPGIKGAMAIIAETEENYATLMKAVGINELRYYEETGKELVYEGATLTGFFTKAKEFFLSVLTKVKALFKKFISMIDALIMNDKDFVKKYRAHLSGINTKDFEYKGYEFSKTELTGRVKSAAGSLDGYLTNKLGFKKIETVPTDAGDIENNKKIAENWTSSKDDHVETMRGLAVGDNAKYTQKEFSEKLFAKFRNGEDKPITINKVNVNEQLEIITNFKDAKKAAQDSYKVFEKEINNTIKDLNTKEKEIEKAINKDNASGSATAINVISKYVEASKVQLSILQQVQGMMMSALKQQSRQAKAICVRLVNYKPKNEGFVYEGVNSALSDVIFK